MNTLAKLSDEQYQLTDEQQRRIDDGLFTLRWSSQKSETPDSEIKTVRSSLLHRSSRFKNDSRARVDAVLRNLETLKLSAMSTVHSKSEKGRLVHAFILLETPDDDVVREMYQAMFDNEASANETSELPGVQVDEPLDNTLVVRCDCDVIFDRKSRSLVRDQRITDKRMIAAALQNNWPVVSPAEREKKIAESNKRSNTPREKQVGIKFLRDIWVVYHGEHEFKQGQIVKDPELVAYALRNGWPVVREDEPITFYPCPKCAARHHIGLIEDRKTYFKANHTFQVAYAGGILSYKLGDLIDDPNLVGHLQHNVPSDYLKHVHKGVDFFVCKCGKSPFCRDEVKA